MTTGSRSTGPESEPAKTQSHDAVRTGRPDPAAPSATARSGEITQPEDPLDPQALSHTLREGLGTIRIRRLEFCFRFRQDCRLPPFLGSTLRGALAHQLRRICCGRPGSPPCADCRSQSQCSYAVLFETPQPPDADRLRAQARLPHPVLLRPPPRRDGQWEAGEELRFECLLIGRGTEHAPKLLLAAQEMATAGLGRDRHPVQWEGLSERHPPRDAAAADGSVPPASLSSGWPLRDWLGWPTAPSGVRGAEPPETHPIPGETAVRVHFETPTRLVRRGRLARRPDLETLVAALLRRVSAIAYFHAGVDLVLDYRGILDEAARTPTRRQRLDLVRLSRYSNRQRSQIPLDGLIGWMEFQDVLLAGLRPLLEAGTLLHVGKGTIFGLGRYRLGWMTPL